MAKRVRVFKVAKEGVKCKKTRYKQQKNERIDKHQKPQGLRDQKRCLRRNIGRDVKGTP